MNDCSGSSNGSVYGGDGGGSYGAVGDSAGVCSTSNDDDSGVGIGDGDGIVDDADNYADDGNFGVGDGRLEGDDGGDWSRHALISTKDCSWTLRSRLNFPLLKPRLEGEIIMKWQGTD